MRTARPCRVGEVAQRATKPTMQPAGGTPAVPAAARRDRRAGLSLVEVLMSVMIITMILTTFGKVFVSSVQLSALNALSLDRVLAASEVRREFTALVRASHGVAPRVGNHETGQDRIVLRMPSADGPARYAVFGAIRGDNRLSRMDLVDDGGTFQIERLQTYALRVAEPVFTVAPPQRGGAVRISLEFQLRPDDGERMPRPMKHHCIASPRGADTGRADQ